MQRIIQQTTDGSLTIAVTEMNVTYHSIHGAVQESMHVFINAGLMPLLKAKDCLHIFEMGLGTALNALLTLKISIENNQKIFYKAVELYPLEDEIYKKLDYPNAIENKLLQTYFMNIHKCKWNEEASINELFTLYKSAKSLLDFSSPHFFDLVYFDAFDPAVQPELWTQAVFEKIFSLMNNDAVLVTYSSKGNVRRNLQAAGFKVEKLIGPPGKREITRAYKAA